MDHLKKAITARVIEKGNTYLDHAEVHRCLKQKQTTTR
jgi:hypothetical protein